VGDHGFSGTLGVFGEDGLANVFVEREGKGVVLGVLVSDAETGVKGGFDDVGDGDEEGVAGGVKNGDVKGEVGGHEGFEVIDVGGHGVVGVLNLFEVFFWGTEGGQFGGRGFDGSAEFGEMKGQHGAGIFVALPFENLGIQVVPGLFGQDDSAAAGFGIDKTFGGERFYGFADNRAADAQFGAESFFLWKSVSRLGFAGENPASKVVGNLGG